MLVKKKKISPIIFNLSVYATFHCPISLSVKRATGFYAVKVMSLLVRSIQLARLSRI